MSQKGGREKRLPDGAVLTTQKGHSFDSMKNNSHGSSFHTNSRLHSYEDLDTGHQSAYRPSSTPEQRNDILKDVLNE
jgi:hypothetical protein